MTCIQVRHEKGVWPLSSTRRNLVKITNRVDHDSILNRISKIDSRCNRETTPWGHYPPKKPLVSTTSLIGHGPRSYYDHSNSRTLKKIRKPNNTTKKKRKPIKLFLTPTYFFISPVMYNRYNKTRLWNYTNKKWISQAPSKILQHHFHKLTLSSFFFIFIWVRHEFFIAR